MALTDSNKKILVWSTIVAVLGIGGYFGYKAFKKKKEESDAKKKQEEEDRLKALQESIAQQSSVSTSTNVGGGGQTASPFKSEAEIKAFQDWLDKKHPLWINDNGTWKNLRVGTASEPNRHVGGRGYGLYGSNTASAYSKWGGEYTITPTDIQSETGVKPNQDDIDKIRGNAYLTQSQKDGLKNRNAEFIKAWADSFRNDRTAFIWSNQVYRAKTGERVLDYNPYLKDVKTNKSGNIAYEYPTKSSGVTSIGKNVAVGKVRNYVYNEGNLWFYLPDNGGNNKWGIAEDFVRV